MEEVSAPAGTYAAVVPLDDLRMGFTSLHEVEGRGVLLARTEDGVSAWDSTCPHAEFHFGPMRLQQGCILECPMHGARFDARVGHVVKGPATEGLDPIESRVENGIVEVLVDWLL
jgi:nitrite reductase/ring-hydroxylating ferredoxin subunit